jgi:hypothetical protein
MSDIRDVRQDVPPEARPEPHGPDDHAMEEYAGGYIRAYHGSIPLWLLAVYFILFIWGLYYMFDYWGGLGPGLDY